MGRLRAGGSLAVLLCLWCIVLASTQEFSGSNPSDDIDVASNPAVGDDFVPDDEGRDPGSGQGTTAAAAEGGSGQGINDDEEDSLLSKLPELPVDEEDDTSDGGSANDVDIDGDNFEPATRPVTTTTTTSSTTSTSSSTSSTTTTSSTTSKSTTVKVWERTADIDVDDSEDVDGEMSGSGVEPEPPTKRTHGPCELKQAERREKNKAFHHKCTEDGYFDQLLCNAKCKCVDRRTGRRDRKLVYDEDREQCVANEARVDIPKPREPSYDLDGDKDRQNNDDDDDDDDDLPKKNGGDGNLLTENPVLFAGIIGGAVVGLLVLILLVMFVVYRMRKKDEGSYALDAQKKPATHPYQRCPQEYYA